MFLSRNTNRLSDLAFRNNKNFRCLATVAEVNVKRNGRFAEQAESNQMDLSNAKPFESIPGPTKLQAFLSFLPGGKFYQQPLDKLNKLFRQSYGEIFLMPGMFGKRPFVMTFNPTDYQTVYRTEGIYPERHGLEVMEYYRTVHRRDLFEKVNGLVVQQGHAWGQTRSIVNPILMNPKTTKIYVARMSQVGDDFIKIIRKTRSNENNEVQDNFEDQLNYWAMESVCLVALDTRLGLLGDGKDKNPAAKSFIDSSKEFFDLMYELDFQVSLWKLYKTPKLKRLMAAMDELTYFAKPYVDAAIERLKADKANGVQKPEDEKSVLERLIAKDPDIATVMALDLVIAGVDTTTSAIVGVLLTLAKNPEKQSKLREEVLQIMPEKDSPLTPEKMLNLPYLRACIKESFRLYPVSIGNFRTTGQDVALSGYRIPKGTDVSMPIQLHLTDPQYYVRPNEYLPERWLRNAPPSSDGCPMHSPNNNGYIYLPFGFGPRICVGKRIVDLELETIVMKLVRNFEIRFDYPVDDVFKINFMYVPNKPLKFKFIDL